MPFAPSATHHNNKRAVLLVAMGIRLDHRERQPRPACRGLFVEHFWRVGCANSNRRLGAAAGAVEAVLWMTTDRFIAAHRAQLVDMLEDNIRMRRWMFDPKTRLDAIRQVADFTKAPIETYADWMFTRDDYYYDPHALVDVARLQKNIEDMSQAGTVPANIDVQRYVDLSLAREAAARIGD